MFSIFAISLLTALAATYLYHIASEELPRILAIFTIASGSLLALVIAPWQIQVLILIVVLITTRNISQPKQRRVP